MGNGLAAFNRARLAHTLTRKPRACLLHCPLQG
jgi:hypothetical protein